MLVSALPPTKSSRVACRICVTSLAYISCELVAFFDYSTPVASQSGIAQQLVQDYVDDMKSGAVLTLGFVKTSQGSWIETPKHRTIASSTRHVYILQKTVFHMPSVTAVRLARAVRNLTSRAEFTKCTDFVVDLSGHAEHQLHSQRPLKSVDRRIAEYGMAKHQSHPTSEHSRSGGVGCSRKVVSSVCRRAHQQNM